MESVVGDADDLDEGIKDLFYELLGAAEDVDAITQIASISMVPDCTAGSSDLFIDAACQPYARQGYFDWESLLEASQAALDDADLIEMMDTLERNSKKINTTL